MNPIQKMIANELQSWPGVTITPHRFGGIEFRWNGKEIGHLHGEHTLDLPFSKSMRNKLVESGRAKPHHMFPESGWVTFFIREKEDVFPAIELCRMNYERLFRQNEQ